MLIVFQGRHRALRGVFTLLVSLMICLAGISPALAAAQTESATPIAPGDLETNAEPDLGTQSVVFARFDQSSETAAPGSTVDMTLTITSTASASTTGTVTIPAVADLTITLTGAQRTENMATCDAAPDGAGGIVANYSLVTGSGTCAIAFTAQLSNTASGTLTVGASVSENGSLASSPSTTITVPNASLSASFSEDVYNYDVATPPFPSIVPVSLVIEMVGPITGGTVSVANPILPPGTTLANPAASLSGGATGTCDAQLVAGAIQGTFSATAPGASSTCTVTFDVTITTAIGPAPLSAFITSAEFPVPQSAITSLIPAIQPLPVAIFNPSLYSIPAGSSASGFVTAGSTGGGSGVITIASDYATISNPVVVNSASGATCLVAEAGDTITVTYTQPGAQFACDVSFTISVDAAEPVTTHLDGITASPAPVSASLNILPASPTAVTASFGQPAYSGTVGGSVSIDLTIAIPVNQTVTGGTFSVLLPPNMPASTFLTATSSPVNPGGTCSVISVPLAPVVSGSFSSDGTAEVICTITMTLSIPVAPITPNGVMQANIISPETGVLTPSTIVNVAVPQALAISLNPTTAAPGDDVTVTVTQTETGGGILGGSINATIPDGVTLNNGIPPTMTCNPVINCTSAVPLPVIGPEVSGSYSLLIGPGTTLVTLEYHVIVDAPAGSSIDFSATGFTSSFIPTAAGPVTLTVQGAAPDATDFDLVVEAGGSVSGSLANHVSSENGIAAYANDPPTGEGSLTLDASTGVFTYTAGATPGTDTIAYTVTDIASLTATGTITVTIIDPLVTADVALHAMPGDTITSDLNDDVSGGQPPHTFTAVSQSLAQGSISIDANGTLTYTATSDATGSDTFTYEVTDGLGVPSTDVTSAAVSTGTITITIIQPMVIAPIALTVAPGATITYDLHQAISGGLAPYTFTLLGQPDHASASIDTTGILTITADADASGTTSFEIQVTDSYGTAVITSAATATGTISLTYSALPTATATATLPSGPTPTATSPGEPTPTATSPGVPSPTATSPGGAVPSPTSSGGLTPPPGDGTGPLPPNPNATATATATSVPTGSSNGVSQLPSTGTGESNGSPVMLLGILAMIALCLTGWAIRRHSQR